MVERVVERVVDCCLGAIIWKLEAELGVGVGMRLYGEIWYGMGV